jgi:hypothetical protein
MGFSYPTIDETLDLNGILSIKLHGENDWFFPSRIE